MLARKYREFLSHVIYLPVREDVEITPTWHQTGDHVNFTLLHFILLKNNYSVYQLLLNRGLYQYKITYSKALTCLRQ